MPEAVIAELKGRERDGLVRLPQPPQLKLGDRVQISRGMFAGQFGLYAGMRPQQRVAVLLAVLGRIELPKHNIEAAR